ncbi:ABC transporter substrate-binding protein [Thioalkalivibrio denitrificans]|uniref:ABC transporter substrate-binding protein n=1 Tax=Thioalkalivibrio denitrificans TaxID=108003 RepID=A0A1V3NG86_9GAMM|nr:PhnD/SsuA/transferrin family substrate-binding protein [Thioalkalivibrio denitrificans]OOG23862.1 ABC transporter substrate-binding protein [Thioalkalivibrio denitrificans]
MNRRTLLRALGAGLATTLLGRPAGADAAPLRIGLTPVFLDDQTAFLNEWRDYLAARLGRPVVFVQRSSYREIVDEVMAHRLDLAWVCGYPFVREQARMRLLAVPLYLGRPLYRSYLIVSGDDGVSASLDDLEGRIFAFSDPNSNSGHLYTLYQLQQRGENPERFFRRTFFTWSHRRVVEAVAVGMADGGAVDGYVWDTLSRIHPEITGQTRVVARSETFGFPPLVASVSLSQADFDAAQSVLMEMPRDEVGARLLHKLNLDGFVEGDVALFDDIAEMARATGRL